MSIGAVAVIIVKDTSLENITAEDTSGLSMYEVVKEFFPKALIYLAVIPDDKIAIETKLKEYCCLRSNVIITTGGIGLSIRDVTPEATRAVIEREVPSITVALTVESLKKSPMAMTSRAVCGIRNRSLIMNFPSSKEAVAECFKIVMPILNHTAEIIKKDFKKPNYFQFSQIHFSSSVDLTKVALRSRESPCPKLEMSKAFEIIDSVMSQWEIGLALVRVEESVNRVMGDNLNAKEPVPPFSASLKNGYACISSDGAGVRRVVAAVRAGQSFGTPLQSGECVRINTGAPLPPGADCVVQVEDTKLIKTTPDTELEVEVEILVTPKAEQNVHPAGVDVALHHRLLKEGTVIDLGVVNLLASAGYHKVIVTEQPTVALLSTGNELQHPSEDVLKPAHIRDSNQTMLKVLLKEYGYSCECLGAARDEPDELATNLVSALSRADVLVCTGGVSMGERDLLKPVLQQDFGAKFHFGRLRMKPGESCTFATCFYKGRTRYIFALPGNPVSAYVCCLLFVIRALRVSEGHKSELPRIDVRIDTPLQLDPSPQYISAALKFMADDLPVAKILDSQCSSQLLSASVLLELPPANEDVTALRAGSIVTAIVTGRMNI